jgi:hypothetical protein
MLLQFLLDQLGDGEATKIQATAALGLSKLLIGGMITQQQVSSTLRRSHHYISTR